MKGIPNFVAYDRPLPLAEAVGLLVDHYLGDSYEFSESLVGEDVIIFVNYGVLGVVVDGNTYSLSDDNPASTALRELELGEMLVQFEQHLGKPYAFEGTFCGPSFKGNPYGLEEDQLFVRQAYDSSTRQKASPPERGWFVRTFNSSPLVLSKLQLHPATVYETPFAPAARRLSLQNSPEYRDQIKKDLLEELQMLSDGTSSLRPDINRAGLVLRSCNNNFTFQVNKEDT